MRPIFKYILVALLLIAVLILLPVVLAPVLHLSHVDAYFDYGGKESDWITFWGNYLGSVITGVISFIILWKTIQSNKEENKTIISANQIENTRTIKANEEENRKILEANALLEESKRKQEYYLRFRSEVSVRLSKIDLSKFMMLYVEYDSSFQDMKLRLETFHAQLIEDYNSFKFLYKGDCPVLVEEYGKATDDITNRITNLLKLYKKCEDEYDQMMKDDLQKKIIKDIRNLAELKPSIERLWKCATDEIEKLKQ